MPMKRESPPTNGATVVTSAKRNLLKNFQSANFFSGVGERLLNLDSILWLSEVETKNKWRRSFLWFRLRSTGEKIKINDKKKRWGGF